MTILDMFRWFHIVGLILICSGTGLLAVFFKFQDPKLFGSKKLGFALHGTGLLLIVLSGFAMLGYKGYMSPFPWWAIVKLCLWLVLGAITVIAKKAHKPHLIIILLLLIAGTAAYLGVMPKI